LADLAYIRAHLEDPAVILVDTRSPLEYTGQKRLAERGGHIPGAVNFDWVNAMDMQNNLRLKPADALRQQLTGLGITPDKEVIVYCQTHHRSAHTYVVLKSLGYSRIKGYPGSWSEWGNLRDTPVE
jgi:thiosulfate/3-mercaptopyruvate sulfurtransferase